MRRAAPGCAVLGLWLVAVAAGEATLWRYERAPAPAGEVLPRRWPELAEVQRAPGRVSLVMLVHPRCPCTRASLAELARLLAGAPGPVDAHVLVVRPRGAAEGWERGASWARAAAIPGVRVQVDVDGDAARRLGATASGHVVIHGPDGRLRFHGGITGARGHEGDNPGRTRAAAALADVGGDAGGPTFGCALAGPADGPGGGDA